MKKKCISICLCLIMILFTISGDVSFGADATENIQQTYELKAVSEATEYSYWEFVGEGSQTTQTISGTTVWFKPGYIKNTKTGHYLINNNGTLDISETAGTNAIWRIGRYNVPYFIYSEVDHSYMTLYEGTLALTPEDECTFQGIQSMNAHDAEGNDVRYDFRNTSGTVARLSNGGTSTANATYVTVTLNDGEDDDITNYELRTVSEATEYSYWEFVGEGSQTTQTISGTTVWFKPGYIKNTKTGHYLINNNGTLDISETAGTNAIWRIGRYNVPYFIYSEVDHSYMTLYEGTLTLTPEDECTFQGIQSMNAHDAEGNDVRYDFRNTSGTVAKLSNGGTNTASATYLTVVIDDGTNDDTENDGEGDDTESTDITDYELKTVSEATEYSDWEFIGEGSQTTQVISGTTVWFKPGYIKNTKTGWYLVNNNGTLGLSETTGINGIWRIGRYNTPYFIYSEVDHSYMTLDKGTLMLTPENACTFQGTQSINAYDAEGNDVCYDFRNTAGTVARLFNGGKSFSEARFLTVALDDGITDDDSDDDEQDEALMDDQDTPNEPMDARQPVPITRVTTAEIQQIGAQIWIFHEITLDTPMDSIYDVKNGTEDKYPKITKGFKIQNQETGLFMEQIGESVYCNVERDTDAQVWVIESHLGAPKLKIVRNYESGEQLVIFPPAYGRWGMYDPKNWKNDLDIQDAWPGVLNSLGGPTAGPSCMAFARYTTDVVDKPNRMPEDGKGYYMYDASSGHSATLLEAVTEKVEDYTTEIPTIEKEDYQKVTTYVADYNRTVPLDDKHWDLLYEANIEDGKFVGKPSCESGVYGVAFRKRTSGCGTSELSFHLNMPVETDEFISVGLRLNDYMDLISDHTGFRIFISREGGVGLKFAGSANNITYFETGYSFAEGRNVYISDNADTNIVTLSFDVNGKKKDIASFEIGKGSVTVTPTDDPTQAFTKFYGYNIYYDGFMSVTTAAFNVEISELQTVIPSYSSVPVDKESETIICTDGEYDDEQIGDDEQQSNEVQTDEEDGRIEDGQKPIADNASCEDEPEDDAQENGKGGNTQNDGQGNDSGTETDGGISIWIPVSILLLAILLALVIVILALLKRRRDEA